MHSHISVVWKTVVHNCVVFEDRVWVGVSDVMENWIDTGMGVGIDSDWMWCDYVVVNNWSHWNHWIDNMGDLVSHNRGRGNSVAVGGVWVNELVIFFDYSSGRMWVLDNSLVDYWCRFEWCSDDRSMILFSDVGLLGPIA